MKQWIRVCLLVMIVATSRGAFANILQEEAGGELKHDFEIGRREGDSPHLGTGLERE